MDKQNSGILLVDKKRGSTSFALVTLLRKITHIEKIGHAGTLDPFATGLMVMLIGKDFTKRSNEFLYADKEYKACLHLGISTDTYDIDGQITATSSHIPTLKEIETALRPFHGEIEQIPPMFSAKKIKGQKLYHLARKGLSVERTPIKVRLAIQLLSFIYPYLILNVQCSKGTYIRSLANDIGKSLNTGAHLTELTRLRSGPFHLEKAISQSLLEQKTCDIFPYLRESSNCPSLL